jgi:hypothetical protein
VTKRGAKELCLEVWRYLADHPEIESKRCLPKELYEKIQDLESRCPLCEVYFVYCPGCPLNEAGERCGSNNSAYDKWITAETIDIRKKAALRIVKIVKAWEPEEEDGDKERS